MIRTELTDMIAFAERLLAVAEPAVLATLFAANGSTYRPLGSMLVSGPPSTIAGGVSGGCLEQYIAQHGRSITQEKPAAMLSFDADPDGEDDGKPSLGCGGSVEVLVERFAPHHLVFLQQLKAVSAADSSSIAACVIDTQDSQPISVQRLWLDDAWQDSENLPLQRLRQRVEADGQSRHGGWAHHAGR